MNTTDTMTITSIDAITLEADDPQAAAAFYRDAFRLDSQVRTRPADSPTSGFRGYTLSLVASQPANVQALFGAAVAAGATVVKPTEKSLWGFGGVVQAPDGAIWNLASSAKKDAGPATREFEDIVLLLGVDDVAASKKFYTARGLSVAKGFGTYVDFATPASPIGLGLYKRRALAKSVALDAEGTGSHRLLIHSDGGTFTDPDGFDWAPSAR
ncbi:VOC family protein [Microbacterium immunditiarum]|uniref:Putative glyoxalase superfamily protein PhnB n=1 Tax=Microbacterium immunditiarum TaxID=337480 RepID=A0A7Y9GNP8_9MICO|nr:VOC family protein [Microbacterium immunditiarum]NYE19722.1 putative glyoxalase superfamily protein PhnB [Microbacterium immunditiarum]